MSKKAHLIFLILLVSSLQVGATERAYISSNETNIFKNASLDSEILTVIQKGNAIEILDRQDIWLQVKYFSIIGWVSRYSVSSSKPYAEKVSILTLLKNFFRTDNKRARVALISTAGGVRGLTDEQSDAIGKTDFASVEIIESLEISEKEINKFIVGNKD